MVSANRSFANKKHIYIRYLGESMWEVADQAVHISSISSTNEQDVRDLKYTSHPVSTGFCHSVSTPVRHHASTPGTCILYWTASDVRDIGHKAFDIIIRTMVLEVHLKESEHDKTRSCLIVVLALLYIRMSKVRRKGYHPMPNNLTLYTTCLPSANNISYSYIPSHYVLMLLYTIISTGMNTTMSHHPMSQLLTPFPYYNASYCHHLNTFLYLLPISQRLCLLVTPYFVPPSPKPFLCTSTIITC